MGRKRKPRWQLSGSPISTKRPSWPRCTTVRCAPHPIRTGALQPETDDPRGGPRAPRTRRRQCEDVPRLGGPREQEAVLRLPERPGHEGGHHRRRARNVWVQPRQRRGRSREDRDEAPGRGRGQAGHATTGLNWPQRTTGDKTHFELRPLRFF
jgi:hypothetical protein